MRHSDNHSYNHQERYERQEQQVRESFMDDTARAAHQHKMFTETLNSVHVEYAEGVHWVYTVFRNMCERIPGVDAAQCADRLGQLLIDADGRSMDPLETFNIVLHVFLPLAEHGSVDNGAELEMKKVMLLDGLAAGMDANTFVKMFLAPIYLSIKNMQNSRHSFDEFLSATRR